MREPDERVAGQRSARQLALDALAKKYCRGAGARAAGGAEAELQQQVHLAELRASLLETRLKVGGSLPGSSAACLGAAHVGSQCSRAAWCPASVAAPRLQPRAHRAGNRANCPVVRPGSPSSPLHA
jgi:hypothetical protein